MCGRKREIEREGEEEKVGQQRRTEVPRKKERKNGGNGRIRRTNRRRGKERKTERKTGNKKRKRNGKKEKKRAEKLK